MRRGRFILILLFLDVLWGPVSHTLAALPVELQPFIGYKGGGSFDVNDPQATGVDLEASAVYGFTLGLVLNPSQQVDVYWSHQDTKLDIDGPVAGQGGSLSGASVDFFQIEGSYIGGDEDDAVRGFVAFGVGATRFGAPTGFSGSHIRFALSIGGGARVALGKSVGLRLQGRWTPSFYGTDETIFCTTGGGCLATVDGGIVSQFELTTGVAVRF